MIKACTTRRAGVIRCQLAFSGRGSAYCMWQGGTNKWLIATAAAPRTETWQERRSVRRRPGPGGTVLIRDTVFSVATATGPHRSRELHSLPSRACVTEPVKSANLPAGNRFARAAAEGDFLGCLLPACQFRFTVTSLPPHNRTQRQARRWHAAQPPRSHEFNLHNSLGGY